MSLVGIANPVLIGWREWAALPELGIPLIKIKIDTGARTSALHAYEVKVSTIGHKKIAEFIVYPIQNNHHISVKSKAEVVGMRTVKSSNGHQQMRIVIRSLLTLGPHTKMIYITLTNRDIMRHRMLLGRTAMKNLLINPMKSYCQGNITEQQPALTYLPPVL